MLSGWEAAWRYMPSLLRASLITLVLSGLSMALAVAFGVFIASGRVYGGKLTRALLAGYVEIIRGTPVLLQLFILYYGIAEAVRLPAFAAALLGLGSTMRLMRVQFTAAHWKPFRGDSSRRRGSWDWAIFRCWRWCADRRRCASHWRR